MDIKIKASERQKEPGRSRRGPKRHERLMMSPGYYIVSVYSLYAMYSIARKFVVK